MIERIIRKFISFGFRMSEKMPLFSRAKQTNKQINRKCSRLRHKKNFVKINIIVSEVKQTNKKCSKLLISSRGH